MVTIRDSDVEAGARMALPHEWAAWASGGAWRPWPHHVVGLRVAARAIATLGGGRLIINMPPGSGKSHAYTRWLPLWYLWRDPRRKIIIGSWDNPTAAEYGREIRNEAAMNERVGVTLSDDSRSKRRWHTDVGGGVYCGGVGAGFMRWRANLLLIDDPYGQFAAGGSALYRHKLREWFHGTMKNRLEPNASIVIVQHRVATDDLTGHLLEAQPGAWTAVRFPALAEADDPLGRPLGAPLASRDFDYPAIRDDLVNTGQVDKWDALYQQAPRLIGAGAVYDHFGEWNIDPLVTIRMDLPIGLALDFNINPGMHGEVFQYDSKRDLFTLPTEFHGPRWSVERLIREFAAWRAKHAPGSQVLLYGDPAGSAAHASDGMSDWIACGEYCKAQGFTPGMRVAHSHPRIVDRVNAVQDVLRDARGVSHAKIHPSCVRLIEDFRKMRRGDDGLPVKKVAGDALSHASEAFGYAVAVLRPVGGPIVLPTGRAFSVRNANR